LVEAEATPMTESEWLASEDPKQMLSAVLGRTDRSVRGLLRPRGLERRMRLLGCAAARFLLPMADPERDRSLRAAIDVAEQLADGAATKKELRAVRAAPSGGDWTVAYARAADAARGVTDTGHARRKPVIAGVVRCVFGNPFRPVKVDASITTPTVVSLAQAAYDERELPSAELDRLRLSVLADALEEAGAGEAIVDHLRSPGPHVRGCWVLDLLLGKG
jgi:hypothetical protein